MEPKDEDIAVGDDVKRMQLIRNKISHTNMDDKDLSKVITDLLEICSRLDQTIPFHFFYDTVHDRIEILQRDKMIQISYSSCRVLCNCIRVFKNGAKLICFIGNVFAFALVNILSLNFLLKCENIKDIYTITMNSFCVLYCFLNYKLFPTWYRCRSKYSVLSFVFPILISTLIVSIMHLDLHPDLNFLEIRFCLDIILTGVSFISITIFQMVPNILIDKLVEKTNNINKRVDKLFATERTIAITDCRNLILFNCNKEVNGIIIQQKYRLLIITAYLVFFFSLLKFAKFIQIHYQCNQVLCFNVSIAFLWVSLRSLRLIYIVLSILLKG